MENQLGRRIPWHDHTTARRAACVACYCHLLLALLLENWYQSMLHSVSRFAAKIQVWSLEMLSLSTSLTLLPQCVWRSARCDLSHSQAWLIPLRVKVNVTRLSHFVATKFSAQLNQTENKARTTTLLEKCICHIFGQQNLCHFWVLLT